MARETFKDRVMALSGATPEEAASRRRDIRGELNAALKESGVSQAALARLLRMTPQDLNGYLRGRIEGMHPRRIETVLYLLDGERSGEGAPTEPRADETDFVERLEAVRTSSIIGTDSLRDRFPDAAVEDDPGLGRPRIRRDIRAELSVHLRRNGITQTEFGEATGTTPQAVNAFLRGRRPLPLPVIEEILFILGGKEKEGEGEL